jgi:hypothetical protein
MKCDYDVANNNYRVFSDSGIVTDNVTTDKFVRILKQKGLWENCVFFAIPILGVKKDSNQYVSKLYDLKANVDLSQTTGTAQPKYQNDGSLLFDGVSDYLSNITSTIGGRTAWTISFALKTTESRVGPTYWQQPSIISGSSGGSSSRDIGIVTSGGKLGLWSGIGGERSIISNTFINDNIKHYIQIRYDNANIIAYVDGTESCRLASTGSYNPATPLYVMAMYSHVISGAAQFHQGELSNLIIHKTALSGAESVALRNIIMEE